MTDGRRYSEEEVRAIIDRALARETAGAGGLSHADLLSVGEQVGVSPSAMAKAAEEVRENRLEQAAAAAILGRRRRRLAVHAAVFAVINVLLFIVNAATTPGEWWVLFSVFFWGLTLLLHVALTFALGPSEAALARERRRQAASAGGVSQKLRVAPQGEAVAELEPVQPSRDQEAQDRVQKS